MRMTKTMHIGVLAARSGRSIHTIRWYEAQGLLPGVTRDGSGRRIFVEDHVGWLDLMGKLRQTGMSIAEMRKYTELVKRGRATLSERRDMLRAHREHVQQEIAEWKRALKLLDSKIDYYGIWQETGKRPKLRLILSP